MKISLIGKKCIFSFTTKTNKAIQLDHNNGFIKALDVVLVDLYTEKKAMAKKIKSMLRHQTGALVHPVIEHVFAINRKGVNKQCTTQSALAAAPIVSGFFSNNFIYNKSIQLSRKYSYFDR